jgi:type III secretion system YseE family protein
MMDELMQEVRDPRKQARMFSLLEHARQNCASQMTHPLPPPEFQTLHNQLAALEAALKILEKLEKH